jgi:hypothetical protein
MWLVKIIVYLEHKMINIFFKFDLKYIYSKKRNMSLNWEMITHPTTGKKHRVDSPQGKKILEEFLLYSQRTKLKDASKQDIAKRVSDYVEKHPELKIPKDCYTKLILDASVTGIFLALIKGNIKILRMAIKKWNKRTGENIKFTGKSLELFFKIINKLYTNKHGFIEWNTSRLLVKTKRNWSLVIYQIRSDILSAYNYSTSARYSYARIGEYLFNKYKNNLSHTPNHYVETLMTSIGGKNQPRTEIVKELMNEIKDRSNYEIPDSDLKTLFGRLYYHGN